MSVTGWTTAPIFPVVQTLELPRGLQLPGEVPSEGHRLDLAHLGVESV